MTKTTYLINSIQYDGSTVLIETTSENWHQIVEQNKGKPQSERRYFFADIINEGLGFDCIVMEVSKEQFDEWSNQSRTTRRSRTERKKYQHIPLEVLINDSYLCTALSSDFESLMLSTVIISELREKLSSWKPWGTDLLDMYISGEKLHSAKMLMERYGVNRRTAFRYKKSFEEFTRKFLLG